MESITEDFIQRYKSKSGNVKGAPECMRISGFVHGITNPELIKRFHEKIPKTVDEMMQVATSFLQGFTLLTKTPKEILALEKGKFKTPPPMTTPVEKRNANKFCEFHGEVGHNTDECNHLRKQIEDMLKAGKLSHIIRELKQSSGKEQPKKKGETSGKEKPQAILMIQSRQKAVRQKITQSFSPDLEISFPSLGNDEGTEGPLIIEAEIGGHQVHRMCIDGGSSFEILYEHCFNQLRPEIRNQMVPATTSLVGFSGEIKWPLGQITLLVKVGDDEHSTSTWMDFMVVARSYVVDLGSRRCRLAYQCIEESHTAMSLRTSNIRCAKLVDAILLSASAFLFLLLGTCFIENARKSPAPVSIVRLFETLVALLLCQSRDAIECRSACKVAWNSSLVTLDHICYDCVLHFAMLGIECELGLMNRSSPSDVGSLLMKDPLDAACTPITHVLCLQAFRSRNTLMIVCASNMRLEMLVHELRILKVAALILNIKKFFELFRRTACDSECTLDA
ncbi:hypothetical protein Tco_0403626 [Tanacetum coccineum]